MSAQGHTDYSVPPPRSESPGPTTDATQASSSRRQSQPSTHQHQQQQQHQNPSHQSHTRAYDAHSHGWNGSEGQPVRLPRITTVNVDAGTSGPTSAPLHQGGQSRNLFPNGQQTGPMRSSSSPDPRMGHSPHGSPSNSPIEPVLGPPSSSRGISPAGSSRAPLVAVPPRRSSHINGSGMSSRSSQQSLGDQDNNTAITPLTFPVPQTRASKRGEPTYCGQCGQVVHGQFVRAMGHVYHLNCFRCKVSPLPKKVWCSADTNRTATRLSRKSSFL
jgi:hypothetical protein